MNADGKRQLWLQVFTCAGLMMVCSFDGSTLTLVDTSRELFPIAPDHLSLLNTGACSVICDNGESSTLLLITRCRYALLNVAMSRDDVLKWCDPNCLS